MIELLLGLALGLAIGYALGEGMAHRRVLNQWLKYYERLGRAEEGSVLKQEPAEREAPTVLKQEREKEAPAASLEEEAVKQEAKTEEAKQAKQHITAMDCVEKVLSAGCATSEQIFQYCASWSKRTLENRLHSLARAGAVSYDPATDLWCRST